MAYDNRNGSGNRYGQGSYGYKSSNVQPKKEEIKPVSAEPLPADYVEKAEEVMSTLKKDKDKKIQVITTNKIRNILSMIMVVYNVENLRTDSTLTEESIQGITMARIRMVYEAGRENTVKEFLKRAKLLEYIKDIGNDRQKLIKFTHYLEALVAYHRFYIGGKEG